VVQVAHLAFETEQTFTFFTVCGSSLLVMLHTDNYGSVQLHIWKDIFHFSALFVKTLILKMVMEIDLMLISTFFAYDSDPSLTFLVFLYLDEAINTSLVIASQKHRQV